jgi:hypothetical protein
MFSTVGHIAGYVAYAALVVAAAVFVVRAATRRSLLAPVLVAMGVRLAVVVVVHAVSVHNGHGGALYLDDAGYAKVGWQIAHAWRSGHADEAYFTEGVNASGSPLYYDFVAAIFFLVGRSMLAVKLVNPILGGLTVLLAGRLAGKVIGRKSERPVAWLVALVPTIVWWAAPMLKEQIVMALVLATLVAAADLPRPSAIVWTSLLVVATAEFRFTFAIALAIVLVPWLIFVAVRKSESALRLVTAALGAAVLLAVVAVLLPTAGHPTRAPHVYSDTLTRFRSTYEGSVESEVGRHVYTAFGPFHVLPGMLRMLVSPRPWALTQVPFDWYQPLFVGMWAWYAIWPLALLGLWRLRRKPLAYLLAGFVIVALAAYGITEASGTRQRSALEPLLAIFAVAGASSAWYIPISAGIALVLISPVVAIDLGDVAPALALAALGVALLGVSSLARGRLGGLAMLEFQIRPKVRLRHKAR